MNTRHESRFIYYSANYSSMDNLIAYLAKNCCQGEAWLPRTAAVNATIKPRRAVKQAI